MGIGKELDGVVESLMKLSEVRWEDNSAFQILMNNVPFGVLLLDTDLRLVSANKAYSDYFDDTAKITAGMHLYDVLPNAEESGIASIIRLALSSGRSIRVRDFRYDGFRKGVTYWNGSAIPVRLNCSADGPYDAVAMVALEVTDEIIAREQLASLAVVAERKANEAELHNARLDAILKSVPIALVVYDSDGRISARNTACEELHRSLGVFDSVEQHGRFQDEVFPPMTDDLGILVPPDEMPIMRSLRGETCRDVILHCSASSKNEHQIFCLNTAPVRDSEGNITGAVGTMADITQQRLVQQQIEESYQREHAIATKLQESFAARDLPEMDGFEYEQAYKPARDSAIIGGDFYDIFKISEYQHAVVMADVAGKGLKSAVYTAMTKFILRAYALEDCDPVTAVSRLNDALNACTPMELFVTLVYGILDSRDKTFTYANAGHEHPLMVCRHTAEAYPLHVTGPALALQSGSVYRAHQVEMRPGDVLVLYTDGITDAGWGVNRFGQEALLELLESGGHHTLRELVSSIMGVAQEYAGGALADDAALLAIKAL